MSDEDGSDLILEPEKKTLGSFLLPAALAAGTAALIYSSVKKSDKKSSSKTPEAGSNEVVFASNYASFSIGDDYQQLVLESYLAEQAEDGNLQIKGETGGLFESIDSFATFPVCISQDQRLFGQLNRVVERRAGHID